MLRQLSIVGIFSAAATLLATGTQQELGKQSAKGIAAGSEAGAGLSLVFGDFDQDGVLDAFALEAEGRGVLYRGDGAGGFTDVTEALGLGRLPAISGAAWEDVDGDGWSDLFLLNDSRQMLLLINAAGLGFLDVSAHSGLTRESVRAATWTDFDADGRLDLVLRTDRGHVLQRSIGEHVYEAKDLGLGALGNLAGQPEQNPKAGKGAGGASGPAPKDTGSLEETDAIKVRGQLNRPTGTTSNTAGQGTPNAGFGKREPLEAPGSQAGPYPLEQLPFTAAPFGCATSLDDTSSGACIQASTIPKIGELYPISVNMFVEQGTGRVGMGTTLPRARTHVVNSTQSIPGIKVDQSATGVAAAVLSSTDSRTPSLEIFSAGEAAEMDGSLSIGERQANGVLARKALINTSSSGGSLDLYNAAGTSVINMSAPGRVMSMRDNNISTVISLANQTNGGAFWLSENTGQLKLELNANDTSTPGSRVSMRSDAGTETIEMLSDTGGGRADMRLFGDVSMFNTTSEEKVAISGAVGLLALRDNNISTLAAFADVTNGGALWLSQNTGQLKMDFAANDTSTPGSRMSMYSSTGVETVEIISEEAPGNGAQIKLFKGDGSIGITMDAEFSGAGRITCDVLEIRGGADLVESFETGGVACEPGTVMVIDQLREGELAPAQEAYDRRVAGVVSGAGGLNSGLRMSQSGIAEGDTPVALTGRVFVRCSGENGAIQAGDLLTSSATVGHAMRATDSARAFGAVIGKAMGSLPAGETGLVLVLVGLQ